MFGSSTLNAIKTTQSHHQLSKNKQTKHNTHTPQPHTYKNLCTLQTLQDSTPHFFPNKSTFCHLAIQKTATEKKPVDKTSKNCQLKIQHSLPLSHRFVKPPYNRKPFVCVLECFVLCVVRRFGLPTALDGGWFSRPRRHGGTEPHSRTREQ